MFLGIIVFVVLAITVTILTVKAAKALYRALTGGNPKQKDEQGEAKAEKKPSEKKAKEEKEGSEKEINKEEEEAPSEELRQRYAAELFHGISETFAKADADFRLDSKQGADYCVENSALTYVEFNNRQLAGNDFFGFNIILEDDERMVLTYNGQALASITKVEMDATAVINGEEVKGTEPGYRVNTYPPQLKEGMVPDDIATMLSAVDRVKACDGDPVLVKTAMMDAFCEEGNISKLKTSIDAKIQSKESARKKQSQEKGLNQKKPRRLTPKV